MTHRKLNPGFPQPMHPSTQQRRSLELARIDAPAGGGERFHPEISRPFPQRIGIKFREERAPEFGRLSVTGVARGEAFEGFGVGEIQAAATGDEKLPAHRRLGIEQRHGSSACRSYFRCTQARWSAADDCNVDAESKQSVRHRATMFAVAEASGRIKDALTIRADQAVGLTARR